MRAKRLLDSLAVNYKALEIEDLKECSEIQDYLLQKTGQRTVPSIFINKEHIGMSLMFYLMHQVEVMICNMPMQMDR